MNTNEKFLKLSKDPNYYRFDLDALFTNGLNDYGWGEDITNFESACEEVAKYLELKHNIKSIWGKGCAEYDKDTPFEYNMGYYLFYKVKNREQGEVLGCEIYNTFCNYTLYRWPENYDYD